MHPTAARELPADQAGWAFEPKWDGYRALGHVAAGGLACAAATGRHGRLVPEPAGLPTALGDHAAVLDGEVVAVDPEGRPSFETLQQRAWCRRPGGGSGSCWLVDESPFAEPAASLLGGRGAGPGPTTPLRCSSVPSWPWRSASSAGSRPAAPSCLQRPEPDTVGSPDPGRCA